MLLKEALRILIPLFILCTNSCTHLFFYPQKTLIRTPSNIGLKYENIQFKTSDGEIIHGWQLPAIGKRWVTLIHFHGNAENISTHLASVYWLPSEGVEVFLFDYRGYGRSTGEPDLRGLHRDTAEAVQYVSALRKSPQNCKAVFGQSLGALLRCPLLLEHQLAAISMP